MPNNKIFWLALGTLLFALSALAKAQQPKVPVIGILVGGTTTSTEPNLVAFRERLGELGYIEGKNISFELRRAEGKSKQVPLFAAELVRLKVDIILASSTGVAVAVKDATSTIPVVMTNVTDPVGIGLISSLSRPGGNITGVTHLNADLAGKRLELLTETIPGFSRIAILWNRTDPGTELHFKETSAAAQALRLQLQSLEVKSVDEFDGAFKAAVKNRADALVPLAFPIIQARLRQIAELGLKNRLPTIYDRSAFIDAGGLMSYGPNILDTFRRAAAYVDKILKGAKPADLPVEQPTKFELVINLKTAKQIGLTIPPNVLARADRVIR